MVWVEALLGGGALLLVILLALPSILLFVAFWRMGAGLRLLGLATHGESGQPSVAQSLGDLRQAVTALNRVADKVEDLAMATAEAEKARAEQLAKLVTQAELAVQWYVHSLQGPNEKPAKK